MPELTSHGGTMAASLRHQWRDTICGGGAYGCILGYGDSISFTYVTKGIWDTSEECIGAHIGPYSGISIPPLHYKMFRSDFGSVAIIEDLHHRLLMPVIETMQFFQLKGSKNEGNNKRDRDGHRIRPSETPSQGSSQRVYDRRDSDTCYKATGAFFICGQGGHLAKDCGKNRGVSNTGNGNNRQHTTHGCRDLRWTTNQPDVQFRDCPLRFDDKIRSANLLPLEMSDFDIILGMDWLTEHRATIDCYSKRVIFGDLNNPKFIYHGSRLGKPLKIISALKARTLISHGCEGFLASIKDTSLDGPRLESHPVVRNFPDVFPDELPGLPPEREVEFTIELIPGAQPISKAPYRMAPVELKELKDQLQELLERGFIRPSISLRYILVYSKTREEHEDHFRIVLEILRQKKLYAKFLEGDFGWGKWHSRVIMYQRWYFYQDPARIFTSSLPLTKLMRKGEKFVWNEERRKEYLEELKRKRFFRLAARLKGSPFELLDMDESVEHLCVGNEWRAVKKGPN
ncbi:putative reverse transcriptase domain-containing protein [Tanacetum coccineum]